MKKKCFLSLLVIMSLSSCSQDEDITLPKDGTSGITTPNFPSTLSTSSDNIFIPDEVYQSFNENTNFQESNSELWIDESKGMLRSSSGTITVTGYTTRIPVTGKNYKVYFPQGYLDKRVRKDVIYLAEYFRYRKLIEIPKGYTLVLPPKEVMSTIKNVGMIPPPPSNQQIGYHAEYYKTVKDKDQYYLVTDIVELVYNIEGREMFKPAVYIPYNVTQPSTLTFKYQYLDLEW